MEEEEEEEGYAIGENWDGGGLREREASRSLGGCLGRREATDIVSGGGRRGWGGITCLYPPSFSLVLVFSFLLKLMILDCLGLSSRPK